MLPHSLLTIPQIQHERHLSSQLIHLTTLLEYVLKLYHPNVTGADGRDPKVGERVLACQGLFNDVRHVLWALKVRNSSAHALENASWSEKDRQNAVNYLIEAIGAVCAHLPRQIVEEIYHDPDAEVRRQQEERERERQQKLRAEELRLEELRRQREREESERRNRTGQESRPRRETSGKRSQEITTLRQAGRFSFTPLVLTGLLLAGGYFLWPKALTLVKGDRGSAVVVRTAADTALKKIKEQRRQKEYGNFINQAEASWRDGEIEFRRGNFKLAEEKYRQVIGLWDDLNGRITESKSFDEIKAEAAELRRAASNAQAQQSAAELWNQAEELRRQAETARRNGNLPEAKRLMIQARQQYEIAQAAAALASGAKTETAAEHEPDKPTSQTTPTPQPKPEPPTPAAVIRPPEKPPANTEPVRSAGREAEDETFPIEEKEFRRYVTRQVPAVLSAQARAAGVSGPVVVRVYLSKYGHLSKAEVIEGDMLLRQSALDALRQWSFKTYLLDRVPTEVKSEITIYVR